ncbi:hypothetical protein JAAARDRAFT_430887 [Jaapia argillacea MUCL 33604]|uniref:Uncharacterized protein n=1 Tax=Jaapia argillacea MUCL 33604 TaxID=933084 RepID=A0A067PEP4_9AGAM|nr:hypothetical protein JAAARDRAFT_430887 [Jaapia argillacea MUCL 33604]
MHNGQCLVGKRTVLLWLRQVIPVHPIRGSNTRTLSHRRLGGCQPTSNDPWPFLVHNESALSLWKHFTPQRWFRQLNRPRS